MIVLQSLNLFALLFVQTGTAHILAISGLHIGVVAAIFLLLVKFIPIGGKCQSAGVIGLLMFYAFLTGGRPSVVRATIMMIVFLASFIVEKERDVLNTLSLSAMIILVYNPLNLFDIGFQLSFVCVLSIIFLNSQLNRAGLIRTFRRKDSIYDRFVQFVCQSIAVSIGYLDWSGRFYSLLFRDHYAYNDFCKSFSCSVHFNYCDIRIWIAYYWHCLTIFGLFICSMP